LIERSHVLKFHPNEVGKAGKVVNNT
jgi:hypothetical protein